MSGKIRIYELAKEMDMSNKELIDLLAEHSIEVKTSSSSIDNDIAELLKEEVATPKVTEVKTVKENTKEEIRTKKDKAEVSPNVESQEESSVEGEIHMKSPIIVKDLADALEVKPNLIISALMQMNIFASINQVIENDTVKAIAEKHGKVIVFDRRGEKGAEQIEEEKEVAPEELVFESKKEDLEERPPIVTFLGHVDHGKTSLQDAIRHTDVTKGEAGGITQHIGASVIENESGIITFIDTPGHEAFTKMRARGANITDIAILVVAADDGVMPQTIEAISHAKAAGVPIIVAINKIDLARSNPDKVLLQLQQNNIMTEDWGGEVGTVRVSAITGEGLDDLLERILLESEMLELKADPKAPAKAYVIEALMMPGMGVVTNILIKEGTLKVGDVIICGEFYGKVKAMIDHNGKRIKAAGPSMPVQLLGLSGIPEAGLTLATCKNEKEAKKISDERATENRNSRLQSSAAVTLEDLFTQMDDESKITLNVIIKADAKGSLEAIIESLTKLDTEKISVNIIHSGIGAIIENDIILGAASSAIVVGFHVRVNPGVNKKAESESVQVRLYSVIYELIADIYEAMEGKLAPSERENIIGNASILQVFQLSKGPKICGCRVDKGIVKVGGKAKVFRDNEIIYNGSIVSLKHFKDSVREVKAGIECGIRLDNFNDFEEHDTIEVYEIILKKAKL